MDRSPYAEAKSRAPSVARGRPAFRLSRSVPALRIREVTVAVPSSFTTNMPFDSAFHPDEGRLTAGVRNVVTVPMRGCPAGIFGVAQARIHQVAYPGRISFWLRSAAITT